MLEWLESTGKATEVMLWCLSQTPHSMVKQLGPELQDVAKCPQTATPPPNGEGATEALQECLAD